MKICQNELVALLAAGVALTPLVLRAQMAAGNKLPPSGPVTIDWHKGFDYVGNVLHLMGGASLTSAVYELHAEDLRVRLAAGKEKVSGALPVVSATAEDPTGKTQVRARFQQVDEGRDIIMTADKAVFERDTSRPDGGRMDFTGHVTMNLRDPAALDGPAVTHADHMVVLLGSGKDASGQDYPHIQSGPGQATFTPLQ